MSTPTKRKGQLCTWLGQRGFGFIAVRESEDREQQKYFLHLSQIVSGKPVVGATCHFLVSPDKEGKLPSAIEVEIEGGVV